MATKLYEIMCPKSQNNGHSYHMAHKNFRADCLRIASGYTVLPECQGAWRDDGRDYLEPVIPLRVACTADQWRDIVRAHMIRFPDQVCVMWYVVANAVHFDRNPAPLGGRVAG